MLIQATEQRLDRLGPDQQLPEQPDRLGVRHLGVKSQAKETHDLQPVVDLEFRLVVRRIVKWTTAPNAMWQIDVTYLKIIALSIIAGR